MIEQSRPYPLGAHLLEGGANFSLYSCDAKCVELLLFDHAEAVIPSRTLILEADTHRTGDYWHCFVPEIEAGQLYGYRVYGPYDTSRGLLFNPKKVVLDPYAKAIAIGDNYDRDMAIDERDNVAHCLKGVVSEHRGYDWENTDLIGRSLNETVIYEMHVKGFTAHPNSGVAEHKRGTYAGVIEKIPYLQELGVTAVELLPVQQFDPQDCPNPSLSNYWGYSPINFFAVHQAYSSDKTPLGAIREFRDMVKALHRAGIEVYLDVVFNHTAEGGWGGPTLSFKGLQNNAYYIYEKKNHQFANYSGCGNTFNANKSVSRRLIRDTLNYWVQEMHIDGFRFDLASILARDSEGHVLQEPPVLWSIETDPVLAGTKIIAEAWDAAGLYQVGKFTGGRWQEWNGKFRDDVRSFVKGDKGYAGPFADRLLGSPDIYQSQPGSLHRSINFVTAHDGFTLNDLVSYNDKHNELNGEGNRDGESHNRSWNCGIEGPTRNKRILELRHRQIKNFIAIEMVALGTPMLTMGDEVCRTQQGNNNAYCQDNEISWFDWSLVQENEDILRFTRMIIHWRSRVPALEHQKHQSLEEALVKHKVQWHGTKAFCPDWSYDSHSIAATIRDPKSSELVYIAINAYHQALSFELPHLHRGRWCRVIDTYLASPDDIVDIARATKLRNQKRYRVQSRTVVVLVAFEN